MKSLYQGKPQREFKYFAPLAVIFVSALLISNTIAVKLFEFGPLVFTGGVVIFPLCYILGDILTEVYGYARARSVIWVGFFANLIMVFFYWLIIELPPASFWPHQGAITQILGQVPRIVLGSIFGYLFGGFSNSYIMAKMKIWTKGKYLWSRTISSTIVGEGIDTLLFIFIAFGGEYPFTNLITTVLSIYIFKVLYEALITPVTYILAAFLKRQEHCDYFDYETSFSPFKRG